MSDRIVIALLGNRHAGKSETWNILFGSTVRTGRHPRPLYLNRCEYVEVFLVSGSPEERGTYVGDIVTAENPRIVLCSMQYGYSVTETINYFLNTGYSMFVQWLNPGYSDPDRVDDEFGIIEYLLDQHQQRCFNKTQQCIQKLGTKNVL